MRNVVVHLAGRNNKMFQNLLEETKKMQTQEVVMDESRSPMKAIRQRLMKLEVVVDVVASDVDIDRVVDV
jgi:hypothetical protein